MASNHTRARTKLAAKVALVTGGSRWLIGAAIGGSQKRASAEGRASVAVHYSKGAGGRKRRTWSKEIERGGGKAMRDPRRDAARTADAVRNAVEGHLVLRPARRARNKPAGHAEVSRGGRL